MSKLVTVNYNLNVEIENRLKTVENIIVTDDATLALARKERAKVNKIIKDIEEEQKNINKLINGEFKESLKVAHDLLDSFDIRIKEADEQRKIERLQEIEEHFKATVDLKWELAPQDEFLKAYPSYKPQVDLWASKIKHELDAIKAFGDAAVELYNNTYDLAQTIAAVQPAPQPETVDDLPTALDVQSKAETYTTLTITVADSVKAEVIDYLESKGVIVG